MKGGWQPEEDFQALSDEAASENEMSLVSMAANETVPRIHIRECGHNDVEDGQRQKDGGREARREQEAYDWMILSPVSMAANCKCMSALYVTS